jgi:hypothetical protein
VTTDLPSLVELERRLEAGCYPDRSRVLPRQWRLAAAGIVLTCCTVVAALLLTSSSVITPAAVALTAAATAVGQAPLLAPLARTVRVYPGH